MSKDGKLMPKNKKKWFTSAGDFSNGVAPVTRGSIAGTIDQQGIFTKGAKMPEEVRQEEVVYPVMQSSGDKYYFRRKNGSIFPENEADWFDDATKFQSDEDFAYVGRNNEYFYIDKLGQRFSSVSNKFDHL